MSSWMVRKFQGRDTPEWDDKISEWIKSDLSGICMSSDVVNRIRTYVCVDGQWASIVSVTCTEKTDKTYAFVVERMGAIKCKNDRDLTSYILEHLGPLLRPQSIDEFQMKLVVSDNSPLFADEKARGYAGRLTKVSDYAMSLVYDVRTSLKLAKDMSFNIFHTAALSHAQAKDAYDWLRLYMRYKRIAFDKNFKLNESGRVSQESKNDSGQPLEDLFEVLAQDLNQCKQAPHCIKAASDGSKIPRGLLLNAFLYAAHGLYNT
jgi:hypothetical protein